MKIIFSPTFCIFYTSTYVKHKLDGLMCLKRGAVTCTSTCTVSFFVRKVATMMLNHGFRILSHRHANCYYVPCLLLAARAVLAYSNGTTSILDKGRRCIPGLNELAGSAVGGMHASDCGSAGKIVQEV